MIRAGLPLALLAPLAGCGGDGTAPGPGGVTVDEAAALDEAAEMLDSQRLPPEVLEEPAAPPAAPAPAPSATAP